MIALWDNDAVLKICAFQLTEEAKAVLEIDCIAVLPTARYKLCPHKPKKRKQAEKRWGAELVQRVEAFLQTCAEIQVAATDVDGLSGIDDLDPGEVLLFKGGALRNEDLVVTGDKRCIRALCSAAQAGIGDAPAIVAKLQGRVLSVEQVFRRIVVANGSEYVLSRMPAGGVDTTLEVVLRADQQQTLEGLDSYIGGLRADVGDLLRPD